MTLWLPPVSIGICLPVWFGHGTEGSGMPALSERVTLFAFAFRIILAYKIQEAGLKNLYGPASCPYFLRGCAGGGC